MKVLIIGAAGMLGRKLTAALLAAGGLGERALGGLVLADIAAPEAPPGAAVPVETAAADLAAPGSAAALAAHEADVVFHLAAVVSGEAEADLDKGYRTNLDGTRLLLEAIRARHRASGYRPRLVFASSIAVFGAPFPPRIPDSHFTTPRTSYGTQKAIGELLVADYARRGFLDGLAIRLPTICVRPGAPNLAASGFFSNILREPLVGREAVLPVDDDVRHWHASPRAAVGFLTRAATIDLGSIGHPPVLTMPGLSATVAEQIAALGRAAGPDAVRLIRRVPDPAIAAMVAGWPRDFAPERALALGFAAESSFDEIIAIHIEDELGGRLP